MQIPYNKEYSALISLPSQVNNPGDWQLSNLRYAGIVNVVNMLQIDNVNKFLFFFFLSKYHNIIINLSKIYIYHI